MNIRLFGVLILNQLNFVYFLDMSLSIPVLREPNPTKLTLIPFKRVLSLVLLNVINELIAQIGLTLLLWWRFLITLLFRWWPLLLNIVVFSQMVDNHHMVAFVEDATKPAPWFLSAEASNIFWGVSWFGYLYGPSIHLLFKNDIVLDHQMVDDIGPLVDRALLGFMVAKEATEMLVIRVLIVHEERIVLWVVINVQNFIKDLLMNVFHLSHDCFWYWRVLVTLFWWYNLVGWLIWRKCSLSWCLTHIRSVCIADLLFKNLLSILKSSLLFNKALRRLLGLFNLILFWGFLVFNFCSEV